MYGASVQMEGAVDWMGERTAGSGWYGTASMLFDLEWGRNALGGWLPKKVYG